jgi:uncharacterized protein YprB with RNaseH-like and TPR domain
MFDAYIDIETTGLSPITDMVTVIGIFLTDGRNNKLVQLVGEKITRDRLLEALKNVRVIYTYNGSRFEVPFINISLGIDLAKHWRHCDLMFECWRNNLYGGLKAVEAMLGIPRQLKGISGADAIRLWQKYQKERDQDSLAVLLRYNAEDVMNLKTLREKLSYKYKGIAP